MDALSGRSLGLSLWVEGFFVGGRKGECILKRLAFAVMKLHVSL